MDINPVRSMVIPNPRSFEGTFEYLSRYLIDAIETIAKNQPNPEPNPKIVDSINVYSRSTKNSDPPKMAQFTAINGRNIPKL